MKRLKIKCLRLWFVRSLGKVSFPVSTSMWGIARELLRKCARKGTLTVLYSAHYYCLVWIKSGMYRQNLIKLSSMKSRYNKFSGCGVFVCRRMNRLAKLVEVFLGAFAKKGGKRPSASSCPSVRPRGTTRLPLDGCLWNPLFEYFSKHW